MCIGSTGGNICPFSSRTRFSRVTLLFATMSTKEHQYLFRKKKKRGGEGCDWLVGLDFSRSQVATYLMRRANSKACCRLSRLSVIIIDGPLKYKCISRRHFRRWGQSTSSATNVKMCNVKPLPRNVMTDVTYCLLLV